MHIILKYLEVAIKITRGIAKLCYGTICVNPDTPFGIFTMLFSILSELLGR